MSTLACPIRAITAGVTLESLRDLQPIERAVALLARARARFESEGFQVQGIRVATSAVMSGLSSQERADALKSLRALDEMMQALGVSFGIGDCASGMQYDSELAEWIAELMTTTVRLRCSIDVAPGDADVSRQRTRMAAEAMAALARATPDGAGNFRFAAAACIPPGTPFFPVAYHDGPEAISVALQAAALVQMSIEGATDANVATKRLRETMNHTLAPIERIGRAVAAQERTAYLGIDSSPAPALDQSIGAAVETLSQCSFGSAGTLDACAAITAGLRDLAVTTCGYSGLMLPVLEDTVLAERASEGGFGLRDLLLFSSVCGTGLDVVPVSCDSSAQAMERMIRDTAALAVRWRKPLSVRLYPVPGKRVGELASFSDPELTSCRVMPLDS